MTTNKIVPIIFTGNVSGQFNNVFRKLRNIVTKAITERPFVMCMCVGDFFGDNFNEWQEYATAAKTIPLPTFILGPPYKKQQKFYPTELACDIIENLSCLGKYGVYITCEGLRIAYISGVDNGNEDHYTFTLQDIEKLITKANSSNHKESMLPVDILISYQWPYNITDGVDDYEPKNSSKLLGYLVSKLRPQYHVATYEKKAFERPPFPHYDDNGVLLGYTRFIGLADMGNPTKSKCIYALKVQIPKNREVMAHPIPKEQTSVNPLDYVNDLYLKESDKEQINPYFFTNYSNKRSNEEDKMKRKKKCPQMEKPCWFCLSGKDIERKLIITIGADCYLALAKGGVVDNHALITTITHYPSANVIPHIAADEIAQYKMTLRQYFRSLKMEIVFYERAYKTTHMQIHCIPLAANLFKHFKPAFLSRVRKENFKLEEYRNGTQAYQTLPRGTDYFYLDLPCDSEYLIRIKDDDFPLSFGRDIIAQDILNVPERTDWQKCVLDDEIALAIVNDFREGYESLLQG